MTVNKLIISVTSLAVWLLVAAGCGNPDTAMMENVPAITEAVAVVHPVGESDVNGIIYFSKQEDVIKIVADITGLTQRHPGSPANSPRRCRQLNHLAEHRRCSPETRTPPLPLDELGP